MHTFLVAAVVCTYSRIAADSLALMIALPSAMSYCIASLRSRVSRPPGWLAGWLAASAPVRRGPPACVLLELPLSSWLPIIDRDISSP